MLARADLDQRIENSFTDANGNIRRSTAWEGVRVDHTTILEAGCKDHVYDTHDITIPLAGSFIASVGTLGGYKPISRSIPGKAYILPAGHQSNSRWEGRMECLSVFLEPTIVARVASEANVSPSIEIVQSCHLDDPVIRHVCFALMAESESDQPGGRLYVESLANVL